MVISMSSSQRLPGTKLSLNKLEFNFLQQGVKHTYINAIKRINLLLRETDDYIGFLKMQLCRFFNDYIYYNWAGHYGAFPGQTSSYSLPASCL